MEWFKRAPGLKIFAVIWLLVALVPLWRLRAARQWDDDQLNGPNMEMKLGMTPERERELARRFPNDPIAQISPTNLQLMEVNRATDVSQPSDRAVALQNYYLSMIKSRSKSVFNRFAALSRQFPDSQIVRAQWLRDTTRVMLLIESKALQASYNQPGSVYPTENSMSQNQIERAIGAAQSGAKIEPDNAFWPWMEAILDFSLRRDDAALTALERAGNCARFDDKILETVRARIELMKRNQITDYEDQSHEAWAILLPHLSRIRSAARAALWQAHLAQKRGDGARALQIAGTVMRAARPLGRGPQISINRLVGQAIVSLSWLETLKNAGIEVSKPEPETVPWTGEDRNRYIRELEGKFAIYARQNRRADLASEAQGLAATAIGDSRLIAAMKDPAFDNLPQTQTRLGSYHWASSWSLRLAFYGAIWWAIGFVVSRGKPNLTASSRRRAVIWSAFCLGATVAILAISLHLGAAPGIVLFAETSPPPLIFDFDRDLPLVLGAVWAFPILLITGLSAFPLPRLEGRGIPPSQIFLARLALVAGTFCSFCIVLVTLGEPLENTTAGQLWPFPLLIFGAFLVATCVFTVWRAKQAKRQSAILSSGALLLTAAYFFSANNSSSNNEEKFLRLYYLALFWIVLVFARWLWIGGFQKLWKSEILAGLAHRIRLAAATLAVCSSVFYFALLLSAMPLRHHAQQILDTQLKIGEIGYIESKLGRTQNNRSTPVRNERD